MEVGLVTHEFDAFFDKDSRVLILGTIPSPKSREQGFYCRQSAESVLESAC